MIKLVSVKTVARQLVVTMQLDDDAENRFTATVDANMVGGKFVEDTGNARALTERLLEAINADMARRLSLIKNAMRELLAATAEQPSEESPAPAQPTLDELGPRIQAQQFDPTPTMPPRSRGKR